MKILTATLVAGALTLTAQRPPESILVVETKNWVLYSEDIADPQRWATSESPVAPGLVRNFYRFLHLSDIVAVNGKPARGNLVATMVGLNLTPEPSGNQAIGDVTRLVINEMHVEMQQADGTPVGSLVLAGLGGGHPPLGAPEPAAFANFAVLGGTGAFLGVRGQGATVSQSGARRASITENPINRRRHPGSGTWIVMFQLIPMTSPEVLVLPNGPAVFHGEDFSQVTAEKPARAGERLIMSVAGLGPVKPNLAPGKPFPPYQEGKLHEVSSPVGVTVNGKPAEVVNKIGWPTLNNVYRVDFVVPEGTAAGMAALGLSVAWINGLEVSIPVR